MQSGLDTDAISFNMKSHNHGILLRSKHMEPRGGYLNTVLKPGLGGGFFLQGVGMEISD